MAPRGQGRWDGSQLPGKGDHVHRTAGPRSEGQVPAPKRILNSRTERTSALGLPCTQLPVLHLRPGDRVAVLASSLLPTPTLAFLQHSTDMAAGFLLKWNDPNTMVRKHQRNPNSGAFYKINALHTSNMSGA